MFEQQGAAPRWRVRTERGHKWSATAVTVVTERPDGARQTFAFADRGDYLESLDKIPEPHAFMARVSLGHGGHSHDYDLSFVEDHAHGHDPIHEKLRGLDVASGGYQDAHELAHANDIRRRFAHRNVTTGQIVLFGLTGGLIPCPAAITVLLLCVQLREFALGAALVLCFSIGLAITLVTVGAAAALGARHASARMAWLGEAARRAPYLSGALLVAVGLYVLYGGWSALAAG
jgi:nickel/cobalt exporter